MAGTDNPQNIPAPRDLAAALQHAEARLVRLEESAGFAERIAEQLSEEIRVLNTRFRELTRRLDGLESRVGGMTDRVEKVEERARPDIDDQPES